MKKWIVGSVVGLVIVGGGAWYALHQVKQEIGKQVVTILSDPATQKEIDKITANLPQKVDSNTVNAALNSVGGNTSGQSTSKTPQSQTNSSSSAGPSTNAVTPNGGGQTTSTSDAPQFKSRQQVVDYAESHFTQAELVHYTQLYMNKDNLTPAQKQEIKQEILSHFTAAEIQAMAAAVKKYQ